MTKARPIRLLLVEDDENDIRITKRALRTTKTHFDMDVVHNGQECLDYLHQGGDPDLILLDMNMPVMDGHETLAALKADDRYKGIPVVVLTTSEADQDIARAYTAQAACYIVKPVEFPKFEKVVQTIEDFWFTVVRLPKP